MNEDDLVAAFAALSKASRVLLGIGDDAAVWQPSRSARSLITTDALIEGVHFSRTLMSLRDAGARAMAANVSDIAAMGGRALFATLALGVPADAARDDILECYSGVAAYAARERMEIAGGDLTRAPVWMLSITVVGEVRAGRLKRRDGVRPNDILAVTGALGASRAGLLHAKGELSLSGELATRALQAFRTPLARSAFGRFLGASKNVHAMMDCSDGLSSDLLRMAGASGVGVRVESVPVAPEAAAAATALGEDPVEFALAGGEDFELIVAVAPRAFAHVCERFQARFGAPLLRVGTAQADGRVVVVNQGRETPLARSGWDHFE